MNFSNLKFVLQIAKDQHRMNGVFLFLLTFLIYFLTLPRGITWGDAGDFITTSYNLGVCHPSGYPLYTILGKIWMYFPFGKLAFRFALLSALTGALASLLIYLIASRFCTRPLFSLIAALSYSALNSVWEYNRIIEVYSLHLFFVYLFFYLYLKWNENRTDSIFYLLTISLGVSFTNHLTTILLIPPYLLVFLSHLKTKGKPGEKLKFALTCLAIVSSFSIIYLYLPLASVLHRKTAICWNEIKDFSSLVYHVTGKEYYYLFKFSPELIFSNLTKFFQYEFKEFYFIGNFMALLGVFYIVINNLVLALPMILYYLLLVAYCSIYTIGDINSYYLSSFGIYSIAIAVGLDWLFQNMFSKIKNYSRLLYYCIFAAFLGYPVFLIAKNFAFQKYDKNLGDDFANIALETAGENSVILVNSDGKIFTLWYYVYCERRDKKIKVIATNLYKQRKWYREFVRTFYPELNIKREEELSKSSYDPFETIVEPNYGKFRFFYNFENVTIPSSFVSVNRGFLNQLLKSSDNTAFHTSPDIKDLYLAKKKPEYYYKASFEWKNDLDFYCIVDFQTKKNKGITIKWINPQNLLYHEEKVEVGPKDAHLSSKFPTGNETLLISGNWKIEILIDGALQASKIFLLSKKDI